MFRKKGGYVYVAESTRKDGSKKIYTGMTQKKPTTRWGQHIKEVKKPTVKHGQVKVKVLDQLVPFGVVTLVKLKELLKKCHQNKKETLVVWQQKSITKKKILKVML